MWREHHSDMENWQIVLYGESYMIILVVWKYLIIFQLIFCFILLDTFWCFSILGNGINLRSDKQHEINIAICSAPRSGIIHWWNVYWICLCPPYPFLQSTLNSLFSIPTSDCQPFPRRLLFYPKRRFPECHLI
jgi:hypothetical protein